MKTTKIIGDAAEDLAVEFLKESGYRIIDRNFRARFGEIDIIAQERDTLVFVEVKKKTSEIFGNPAEMVTTSKIKKIIKTAEHYLLENKEKRSWRIDVVAITGKRVELIKNITNS